MTIESLNLFSGICMVTCCVIGIVKNPPDFDTSRLRMIRSGTSAITATLSNHSERQNNFQEYYFRHIARSTDGENQYYRFTISKAGASFRAYIDSTPHFAISLDQLGAKIDNGCYYIDAGHGKSAADAERAAKNWADTQSGTLRISQ